MVLKKQQKRVHKRERERLNLVERHEVAALYLIETDGIQRAREVRLRELHFQRHYCVKEPRIGRIRVDVTQVRQKLD